MSWSAGSGRGGTVCPPAGFPPDPCRTVGAVINRPGDSAGVPAGQCAPHSLFGCAKKRTRRARCKRKRRRARSGAVALRAYGGRRTSACSDLALPSGTLCSSAISPTAVPWRMVRKLSGCKNAFDQLLFPRGPLRYALPGRLSRPRPSSARCGGFHQPPASGSENQRSVYPRLPRAEGFPKGRAFPSLTAARDCQPSPAGGRRSAPAQTDPPRHFFFSTGRGAFSF